MAKLNGRHHLDEKHKTPEHSFEPLKPNNIITFNLTI